MYMQSRYEELQQYHYDVISFDRNYNKPLKPMDKIYINASLLKTMFYKGKEIDYCPYYVFRKFFVKDAPEFNTLSQLKGLYFESGAIGGSVNGSMITDLPRNKNGKKNADHRRIDKQIRAFEDVFAGRDVVIYTSGENKNVQVKGCVKYEHPKGLFSDLDIYLHGTADIISPVMFYYKDTLIKWDVAIIDLKLTGDRDSTWGKFGWGNVKEMDHTQPYLYHIIFGLPFVYWVWDYRPSGMGEIMLPKKVVEDKTELGRSVGKDYVVLHDTIKRCIEKILDYNANGWSKKPSEDNCKNCGINSCNGGWCEEHKKVNEK